MKTILVVDDDFEVREMLTDYLSVKGYNVVGASNGREGLDTLAKNNIDIIILDLAMPVMNGVDCLKEIRKERPDFPVIIISGNLNEEFLAELEKLSAKIILEKPIDIHRLNHILQKI